jgi:hypothetical protein
VHLHEVAENVSLWLRFKFFGFMRTVSLESGGTFSVTSGVLLAWLPLQLRVTVPGDPPVMAARRAAGRCLGSVSS